MRIDPDMERLEAGFVQVQPKLFRLKAADSSFKLQQPQYSSVWLIKCSLHAWILIDTGLGDIAHQEALLRAINRTITLAEEAIRLVIGQLAAMTAGSSLPIICMSTNDMVMLSSWKLLLKESVAGSALISAKLDCSQSLAYNMVP